MTWWQGAIRAAALGCAAAALCAATGAQRTPRWHVVLDCVEALSGPNVDNPSGASASTVSIGGAARPALSQHPDAAGKPPVHLTFRGVALPALAPREKLTLELAVGIREGFSKAENPIADGCAFIVRVGDEQVLRLEHDRQAWREARVDLGRYAGRTVDLTFLTDPRANSAFDWAVWGAPRIVVEGRRAVPRPIPAIAFLRLSALAAAAVPPRIVGVERSPAGVGVTTVLDRALDLPALLADEARRAGPPPAPTAPPMVVGEGPDPANHTLVRVLDGSGVAAAQFLAFGPDVRGGVSVGAGDLGGGARIAAVPIADAGVREVRLFTRGGLLVRSIAPDRRIQPPYAVAVGDFLPERRGAEIAVTGAGVQPAGGFAAVYSGAGTLLRRAPLPGAAGERVTISRMAGPGHDRLLVSLPGARRALVLDLRGGSVTTRALPPGAGPAWASAFGDATLLAPGADALRSAVTRAPARGAPGEIDVGGAENRFWIQWYDPQWAGRPDGRYVRKSVFRHLRTDGASPACTDPKLARDPAACAGEGFLSGFRGVLSGYDSDLPALWEPCFTHRWMKGRFQAWRDAVDPVTRLPRYVALSRNNRPAEYGEFGTVDFYTGSYAFGLAELDNLYVLPLRAFLRALAPRFRANPEHFVALEPNHEHEIAIEADGSVGDYNPRMIEGFYRYLRDRYGDLRALQKALGTPFTTYFDAPRNWERGPWDAYDPKNPFFREWVAYNRAVVSRRIAETFREALLAGFPPEIVKCHQIPDTYAIGKLSAFSTLTSRITPIDWALNAGVGYGFTRYGVWYDQRHDALQDAHAAGFDGMSLGEYQALTPDERAATNQLRYIAEHGGMSVHCMMWPEAHDRGYNATMDRAARRLLEEDAPRPGYTGGVGQVRAFRARGRAFDIACLGTGPQHTGLLKSLNEDGTWEGSVYVVPFHAHVEVQPVRPARSAAATSVSFGPLDGLDSGCQVEVTLRAAARKGARIRFAVTRGGRPLPGLSQEVTAPAGDRRYRFVLRAQSPSDGVGLALTASGAAMRDVRATRQAEQTPKLPKGVFGGRRHRGGVTFDLL